MREPDRHGVLETALPRTRHQQRWHPRRFRNSGRSSILTFFYVWLLKNELYSIILNKVLEFNCILYYYYYYYLPFSY